MLLLFLLSLLCFVFLRFGFVSLFTPFPLLLLLPLHAETYLHTKTQQEKGNTPYPLERSFLPTNSLRILKNVSPPRHHQQKKSTINTSL